MRTNKYYFYWKSEKAIYRGWAMGYSDLFKSDSIIFGDLETLKVLYVKV